MFVQVLMPHFVIYSTIGQLGTTTSNSSCSVAVGLPGTRRCVRPSPPMKTACGHMWVLVCTVHARHARSSLAALSAHAELRVCGAHCGDGAEEVGPVELEHEKEVREVQHAEALHLRDRIGQRAHALNADGTARKA